MSPGPIYLMVLLFWLCAAVPVYSYGIFPALLAVFSRLAERPVKRAPHEPFVSILVPAYNESAWIEAKIRNVAALDYPADRYELVIASDGSKDKTAELALCHADGKRVRVLDYKENRGKVGVLNAAVPECKGEIILFSDASAMLNHEALRVLMENFADPEVGGVCGAYRVVNPDKADIGAQEDLYWKYETALKLMESKIDSILGGHGQIHALRKPLYSFPPRGTVNDDFVIPMRVVSQGYREVYDPRAVAVEEAREMSGFGRRVRIMAGNIQQLAEAGNLLRAGRWVPLFCFISHKVTRLMVPFAMIGALVLNVWLANQAPLYAVLLVLQLAFYLLVLLGAFVRLHPKILRLPYYFCMVNAAIFAGIYHAIQGRRRMAWK